MTTPLSIEESADLIGRYRYVELLAFNLLGERAPSCDTPKGALFLASASRAHAYRAQLFEELLPVSLGLPSAKDLTRTPDPLVDEALRCCVAEGRDVDVIYALISAVYKSALIAYEGRLSQCAGPADRALSRTLRRAIGDVEVICGQGRELGARLGAPTSDRAESVETLLSRAGGLFGPSRRSV